MYVHRNATIADFSYGFIAEIGYIANFGYIAVKGHMLYCYLDIYGGCSSGNERQYTWYVS